jgi:mRNA deadenylase 3'-5' endonuclease subunit Ccr4
MESRCQPLLRREWQPMPSMRDEGQPGPPRFRLMTWNCLADGLAQDGAFALVSPAVERWLTC